MPSCYPSRVRMSAGAFMRKRMVSPELFKSDKVALLPLPTMVTWIGTWCYLDDYGRGENDEQLVRSDVYPRRPNYTARKVRADLDRFIRDGLLCSYEVNGYDLIHSPSWQEHQKMSHPLDSKLPPCPEHDPGLWTEFITDNGGPLDKYRDAARRNPRKSVAAGRKSAERPCPNVVEVNPIEGSLSGPEACRSVLRSVKTA